MPCIRIQVVMNVAFLFLLAGEVMEKSCSEAMFINCMMTQVQVDVGKIKNLGLVSPLFSMCKLGYVGHSKRTPIVIFIVNLTMFCFEEE